MHEKTKADGQKLFQDHNEKLRLKPRFSCVLVQEYNTKCKPLRRLPIQLSSSQTVTSANN